MFSVVSQLFKSFIRHRPPTYTPRDFLYSHSYQLTTPNLSKSYFIQSTHSSIAYLNILWVSFYIPIQLLPFGLLISVFTLHVQTIGFAVPSQNLSSVFKSYPGTSYFFSILIYCHVLDYHQCSVFCSRMK